MRSPTNEETTTANPSKGTSAKAERKPEPDGTETRNGAEGKTSQAEPKGDNKCAKNQDEGAQQAKPSALNQNQEKRAQQAKPRAYNQKVSTQKKGEAWRSLFPSVPKVGGSKRASLDVHQELRLHVCDMLQEGCLKAYRHTWLVKKVLERGAKQGKHDKSQT